MSFKEFKKLRSKNFTTWYRRGKRMWPEFAAFDVPEETQVAADTELTDLTNRIGDKAIAKRVQQLQYEYPNGTIPELVTMDWLNGAKYKYIYQGRLFGGRATAGGLLPDFIVETGGADGAAWQIQGDYWHGKSADKQFSDAADNQRLLGQTIGGVRIGKVISLWESDVLNRRPLVFQLALAGISLR